MLELKPDVDSECKSHSWQEVASMLEHRGSHGLAVVKNKLFIIGGGGLNSNIPSCECYDTKSKKWSFITPMPSCRHALAGRNLPSRRPTCMAACPPDRGEGPASWPSARWHFHFGSQIGENKIKTRSLNKKVDGIAPLSPLAYFRLTPVACGISEKY